MIVPTTLGSLGDVNYFLAEYVPAPIGNAYASAINQLHNNLTLPATAGLYDQVTQAQANLIAWAKKGFYDPDTKQTYYMSLKMVEFSNLIVASLNTAGIPLAAGATDAQKTAALQHWQSFAPLGVSQILAGASAVDLDSHTLQSFVELEYVKRGNDYIASNLINLQRALSTTQGVLDTLQIIQGISNQITVMLPQDFAFPPSTLAQIPYNLTMSQLGMAGGANLQAALLKDASAAGVPAREIPGLITNLTQDRFGDLTLSKISSTNLAKLGNMTNLAQALQADANANIPAYQKLYRLLASAHFSQIFPVATPTATAAAQLFVAAQSLYSQVGYLEQQGLSRNSVNSLPYFLRQIAENIGGYVTAGGASGGPLGNINDWILDNQNKRVGDPLAQKAGSIQSMLTQAIQTAQNLNDSQKQNVSQYLMFFNQFYKSASDVLQQVTQMAQRMAQLISR
jgi:hypothetical protein